MNKWASMGLRGTMWGAFAAVLWTGILLFGCAQNRGSGSTPRDEKRVLFTYVGPAQRVCVSGDFNAWSVRAHCMKRYGQVWKIEIPIPPGTYAYGYLVDGTTWKYDPNAPFYAEDFLGRRNSLLILE